MKTHCTHSRSGSTMVIVAMLIAAVAMLSLSFLTVLRSTQKENQGSRESLSALYACEAGLSLAMDDVKRGNTGPSWGTEGHPTAWGSQQYWVTATPMSDGRLSLVSYGKDDHAQMGVELVVQQTPQGFFRWAAFGDESMAVSDSASTDSYDSEVGDYASQRVNGSGPDAYANSAGDIGSNASILMDSSASLWGAAHPGPAQTVSGSGLANISGSITPGAAPTDLPPIQVPAIASSGGLTVSASQLLSSGDYHFDSLKVNDGKTLTIYGPAKIVCGELELKPGAELQINASDGPVEFFVLGDFVMSSNTRIGATDQRPQDVVLNLLSDNIVDPGVDVDLDHDELGFDSHAKLYGTLYAPNAEIAIDSDFELFGSLVARRLALGANCHIHYDEALATQIDGQEPVYESLCWHLLKQP